MEEEKPLVDINHASEDELKKVPGIGASFIQRIISGRPYEKVEDLLRVSGIKAKQLLKWASFLTAKKDEPTLEIQNEPGFDTHMENPESNNENLPAVITLPEQDIKPNQSIFIGTINPPNKQTSSHKSRKGDTEPLTHMEAVTWGGGIGLLILILSIVFNLAILGGVNGGLSYISSNRYSELQSQVSVLSMQAKQLESDTRSLQERMNSLEGLSGRVASVEKESKEVKDQINQNAGEVKTLVSQTQELQSQVSSLKQNNQAIETFITGLKTLLETVFPKKAQ